MSYRILLPEKTAAGGTASLGGQQTPIGALEAAGAAGVSDAFCAQSPQPAGGAGGLSAAAATTGTEEATAAPCAGVWGGIEVGPFFC